MNNMNNKYVLFGVGIAILVIVAFLVYSSGPIVSAQGQASIKVQPDEISIYTNIDTKETTLKEAQDKNSQIRESLLNSLLDTGIEEKDIQFSNYNSYPWNEWINGQSVSKGFVVNQQIIVKSSSFSKVPRIVDKIVDSGAMISYINFELSQEKQNQYKTQALQLASQNAKDKAGALASGQGKNLGRLVSLKSDEFNYTPYPYYSASAEAGASDSGLRVKEAVSSISPRELEVSGSVVAEYKVRLI